MSVLSRRGFLRLLGAGVATTALPACFGSGPAAVAEKPAVAPKPAAAQDDHGGLAHDLWEKTGGDDLLHGKSFQAVFNALPTRMDAFKPKDQHLRCIDEGVPGGIHMAGSGCLYEGAEKDLKGKITGIYTHDDCCAARLYVQTKGIKTDDPDAIADAEAKKLAEKLGVPFLGRIKAAEMKRPSMHDARAVYYDGTGKMDPSLVPGLPKGFMISRKHISDVTYALTEADVAIGIARGDHGFGPLFSGRSPFYLVGVTGLDKDSIPAQTLANELKPLAERYPNVAVHILDVGPAGAAAEPAKAVIFAPAAGPAPAAAAKDTHAAAPAAAKDAHAPAAAAKDAHAPAAAAKDAHAPAAAGAKDAHAAADGHGGAAGPRFGPTFVIKDRIVNLADQGGRRFLRFSVAIEFQAHAAALAPVGGSHNHQVAYVPELDEPVDQPMTGGADPDKEFQKAVKKYAPAMEDVCTTVLSSKTYEQIRTPAGKDQAKAEIKTRIQALLGDAEHVTNIYFTDFIIQ